MAVLGYRSMGKHFDRGPEALEMGHEDESTMLETNVEDGEISRL